MQNSELSQSSKEYLLILKEYSPYDFSEYSDNSIDRRIQKFMHDYHLSMPDLIQKTKSDSSFVEQVVEAITVNTTELFRDPKVWYHLLKKVLPTYKNHPKINVWHAGCSTGQEVYSLIILLDALNILDKADIYATDISQKAIEQAKRGSYRYSFNYEKYMSNFLAAFEVSEVPDFKKYFNVNETKDTISIKPQFLSRVKYVKHDLVKEELPFYNKFDLIFCRNVLIYFNGSLQTKIVQRFHDNLFPGGNMVLGSHETVNGFFKTKFAKNGPVYARTNSFHFKY
jgi:chemotaxis protein methyltransferase CheR